MYLLFLDESGTHGAPHPFVLGGIALHEDDAERMQNLLDELIKKHLGRIPPNLEEYELHAGEMRNAKKPKLHLQGGRSSVWSSLDRKLRLSLLDDAYAVVRDFENATPHLPHALFGVVVERHFHPTWSDVERERYAYEVLLNKFDVMLKRLRVKGGHRSRGLVIHDRRIVAEEDIQRWTSEWRAVAGTVGQLKNLADVPLFSDSRATRLLQVADLVSYALFRRYDSGDSRYLDVIMPRFDADGGVLHGCVHFTPKFGNGSCACGPCDQRLKAEARSLIARNDGGRHR